MARRAETIELAAFAVSDADELFLIRGDAEAMRFWDWPADQTVELTRSVARGMLEDVERGSARIWTVRRSRDQAFVGIVDLGEIAGGRADLGFMIRRDLWGQGYAFAAATLAVLDAWAMGLSSLSARIHADNERSERLLQRMGFALQDARDVDIRPGVIKRCRFFGLARPRG